MICKSTILLNMYKWIEMRCKTPKCDYVTDTNIHSNWNDSHSLYGIRNSHFIPFQWNRKQRDKWIEITKKKFIASHSRIKYQIFNICLIITYTNRHALEIALNVSISRKHTLSIHVHAMNIIFPLSCLFHHLFFNKNGIVCLSNRLNIIKYDN